MRWHRSRRAETWRAPRPRAPIPPPPDGRSPYASRRSGPARCRRRRTIGHSFGGLIVYTALSQYFINSVVQSDMASFSRTLAPQRPVADQDKDREIAGYGDLV